MCLCYTFWVFFFTKIKPKKAWPHQNKKGPFYHKKYSRYKMDVRHKSHIHFLSKIFILIKWTWGFFISIWRSGVIIGCSGFLFHIIYWKERIEKSLKLHKIVSYVKHGAVKRFPSLQPPLAYGKLNIFWLTFKSCIRP